MSLRTDRLLPHRTLGLMLWCLLCLLAACKKTVLRSYAPGTHHQYRSPDATAWQRTDTLVFLVPAWQDNSGTDTPPAPSPRHPSSALRNYDARIALRLLDSYPYRDLTLQIDIQELLPLRRRFTLRRTVTTDGSLLQADTLVTLVQRVRRLPSRTFRCDVFDSNDQPHRPTLPHLLVEQQLGQLQLNPRSTYRISITHHMRLDPLPGISDVGLILTPTEGE